MRISSFFRISSYMCVEVAATLDSDLLTRKQNREMKNIFFGNEIASRARLARIFS